MLVEYSNFRDKLGPGALLSKCRLSVSASVISGPLGREQPKKNVEAF